MPLQLSRDWPDPCHGAAVHSIYAVTTPEVSGRATSPVPMQEDFDCPTVPVLDCPENSEPSSNPEPNLPNISCDFDGANPLADLSSVSSDSSSSSREMLSQKLREVRKRFSLSPLKLNMENAQSILKEYRRRSNARLPSTHRSDLPDLPVTETIEEDSPPPSRPFTRSQGLVPEVANVQPQTLEYFLKK